MECQSYNYIVCQGIGGNTDELQLSTTDTMSMKETGLVSAVSKQWECIENG